MLSGILKEIRSNCPPLKYPQLTSEMNNLLWTIDGIEEAKERINKSTSVADIVYYQNCIVERVNKIKNNYLYLLN